MRVTVLGVNSAFYVGTFERAISIERLKKFISTNPELPINALLPLIEDEIEHLYNPAWQSNFLIEFDMPNKRGVPNEPYRLLLDCGGDIRHALKQIGLEFNDIDGVYISHPHADHIGGLEGFALTTIFNPNYTKQKRDWLNGEFIINHLIKTGIEQPPPDFSKPDLYIHHKVLSEVRTALRPGLDTLQGLPYVKLETYFNIIEIGRGDTGVRAHHTFADGNQTWQMGAVFTMHVISSSEEMPSYGISLISSNGTFVLFPTDTQHMVPPQLEALYQRANVIYMDCETSKFPSSVHPHVSDLIKKMPPEIQKKCYLYHYQTVPEVPEGMFKGILKNGETHHY